MLLVSTDGVWAWTTPAMSTRAAQRAPSLISTSGSRAVRGEAVMTLSRLAEAPGPLELERCRIRMHLHL